MTTWTEEKDDVYEASLVVILIGAIAILLIIYGFFVFTAVAKGHYTWTQYFIEFGDSFGAVISALAIFIVLIQLNQSHFARLDAIKIANQDRALSIRLHEKEIALNRMKEDLQFYAKLLGLFDGVFQPSDDYVMKVINFTQAMKQENIRYEYRLHSTPELKIKLEHFFEYIYDEIQVQLYKKNRDLHEQSILNYFHEIIKQVEQDFEQKEKEYLDLHSLPLTMS